MLTSPSNEIGIKTKTSGLEICCSYNNWAEDPDYVYHYHVAFIQHSAHFAEE